MSKKNSATWLRTGTKIVNFSILNPAARKEILALNHPVGVGLNKEMEVCKDILRSCNKYCSEAVFFNYCPLA